MAAKKSTKKVKVTLEVGALEKLIEALDAVNAADGFEKFVDDPDVRAELIAKKRAAMKRR